MKNKNILLGVNIDHVANVREARGTQYPSISHAINMVEQSGADSITMHLREDRRHIQDRDVYLCKEIMSTHLNLEMAITNEMLAIAVDLEPEDCCLVPEKREELTTEGGLNVLGSVKAVESACTTLAAANIRASIFIDPNKEQIKSAFDCGAPVIEIHTGHYANARTRQDRGIEFSKIVDAANYAAELGLHVNAGHGLDYHNVGPIAGIECIEELNIGHSIVARAIFTGLGEAVYEMKSLMLQAR